MSRYLPKDLTVQLVLQRAMPQAGTNNILHTMDVQREVKRGQLGREELPHALEKLLSGHVEGVGREGGEGVV